MRYEDNNTIDDVIDEMCNCEDEDRNEEGHCPCVKRIKWLIILLFITLISFLSDMFSPFLDKNKEIDNLNITITELTKKNEKLNKLLDDKTEPYCIQNEKQAIKMVKEQYSKDPVEVVVYKKDKKVYVEKTSKFQARKDNSELEIVYSTSNYDNGNTPSYPTSPVNNNPYTPTTSTPSYPSVNTPYTPKNDDNEDNSYSGIEYPTTGGSVIPTDDDEGGIIIPTTDPVQDVTTNPITTTPTDDTTDTPTTSTPSTLDGYKQVVFANNTVSCRVVQNGGCVSHKRNVEVWIKDSLSVINSAYSPSFKAVHIDTTGDGKEDFMVLSHPNYVNQTDMIIKIDDGQYETIPYSEFYTITDSGYSTLSL